MAVNEILRRTPFAGGVPGFVVILAGSVLLLPLLRVHPRPGRDPRRRPAPWIAVRGELEADKEDVSRSWGSSIMSMILHCAHLVLHVWQSTVFLMRIQFWLKLFVLCHSLSEQQ